MTVEHKKGGNKGVFYVEFEGEMAAEMVYTMAGEDTMILEHIEVDDVLKGSDTGFELVHASVEYARHHGLKILPVSPFAKAVFDKKPDFWDVLG